VHEWALRHIFVELRHYTGASPSVATAATFFVSALLHELIFSVAFKTLRPWFFLGMVMQIPLMALGRCVRARAAIQPDRLAPGAAAASLPPGRMAVARRRSVARLQVLHAQAAGQHARLVEPLLGAAAAGAGERTRAVEGPLAHHPAALWHGPCAHLGPPPAPFALFAAQLYFREYFQSHSDFFCSGG
jgi:hypothetical protein